MLPKKHCVIIYKWNEFEQEQMSFKCAIQLFQGFKAICIAFAPHNERAINRSICMEEFVPLWVYNDPTQTSWRVNKEPA